MIYNSFKSYIWLMPFCFFCAGYMIAHLYMKPALAYMPSFVGMSSTQALNILSDYHLVPHIIAQKEENNVPHGTILQQTPAPGHTIKQRQSVFLVVSTAAAPTSMPDYMHKTLPDIQRHSKEQNSTLQIQYIPHIWPYNTCFAQWPSANEPLTQDSPIVYISAGNTQPVIWPNFIGADAQTVISFLQEHHVTPDIICHYTQADTHSYAGYYVTDQRPLAGSCVVIDTIEKMLVQLRVE